MMRCTAATLLACALTFVTPAASLELQWTPPDTTLRGEQQASFAVMLDDSIDVRTVELRVTYDPTVVTSVSGGFGDLFDGFQRFTDFQVETPGRWYGYCVILGADDWARGPGELFTWSVAGTATGGESLLQAVELNLIAPGGQVHDDCVLPDGMIRVLDSTSAPGSFAAAPELSLHPNPFNPRTTLRLVVPGGGAGTLDVLDLRGRRVATPWSGTTPAGASTVIRWDATDASGRPLPSGTYTFRYRGHDQTTTTLGTVVR